MLKSLDKVLMNPTNVNELQEEIKTAEKQLQNPHMQDKQGIFERVQRMKKQLEEDVADGHLTGEEKDSLAKEELRLRNKITEGMLSEEIMRKCPSTAPNDHIAWEEYNLKDIMRWKNIRQQLDPHNPEAANLERFRPSGAQGRGYRGDAVIPGKMSYGDVPQEAWDKAFSKPIETLQEIAQEVAKPEPKKRSWTQEQRDAARDRLKAARDKKAAERQVIHEEVKLQGLAELG